MHKTAHCNDNVCYVIVIKTFILLALVCFVSGFAEADFLLAKAHDGPRTSYMHHQTVARAKRQAADASVSIMDASTTTGSTENGASDSPITVVSVDSSNNSINRNVNASNRDANSIGSSTTLTSGSTTTATWVTGTHTAGSSTTTTSAFAGFGSRTSQSSDSTTTTSSAARVHTTSTLSPSHLMPLSPSVAVRTNGSLPSIVIKIDIDLGTLANSTPPTVISSTPPIIEFPTGHSLPSVTVGSGIGLVGNGSQVVCFSLPQHVLTRLIPIIQTLTNNPTSVINLPNDGSVPEFGPNFINNNINLPVYNPIPPAISPIYPVGNQQLNEADYNSNNNNPSSGSVGPYGIGAYGGSGNPAQTITNYPNRAPQPMSTQPPIYPSNNAGPAMPAASYSVTPSRETAYHQPSRPTYATVPLPTRRPSSNHQSYGQGIHQPPDAATSYHPSLTGINGGSGYGLSSGSSLNVRPSPVVSQAQNVPAPGTLSGTLRHPQSRLLLAADGATQQKELVTENTHTSAVQRLCNQKRDLVPDAITLTPEGVLHVFWGNATLQLRETTNGKYRPTASGSIATKWHGLGNDVAKISAATTRRDGVTFLFSADHYWKFDANNHLAPDWPKKVVSGFPGLPVINMDAVYQASSPAEDMNFIQGQKYYSYNHKRFPPYHGPTAMTEDPGLPREVRTVDAAYTDWKSGDVVFVSGTTTYRFSSRGPEKHLLPSTEEPTKPIN